MLVIDWSRLPEPYQACLRDHVANWAHLLPVWVQYLVVSLNTDKVKDDEPEAGECDAKEHYRMVQIRVTPDILRQPWAMVEQNVVHELVHAGQSTYDRLVDEVLELVPTKQIRKFYRKRLVEARESMTEDLVWSLLHKRNADDPD